MNTSGIILAVGVASYLICMFYWILICMFYWMRRMEENIKEFQYSSKNVDKMFREMYIASTEQTISYLKRIIVLEEKHKNLYCPNCEISALSFHGKNTTCPKCGKDAEVTDIEPDFKEIDDAGI